MINIPPLSQPMRQLWSQRTPRERLGLQIAAALLIVFMVWKWGLAPALQVWREAPVKQAQIQATTQRMLSLQTQAATLKNIPQMDRAESLKILQDPQFNLGPETRFTPEGDRLKLKLKATPTKALAEWLIHARQQARSVLLEADLVQAPKSTPETGVHWQGTLTLRLP